MPDARDYAEVIGHPLRNITQECLDVARETMRGAVEWKDVHPDTANPLADAIIADLAEANLLSEGAYI